MRAVSLFCLSVLVLVPACTLGAQIKIHRQLKHYLIKRSDGETTNVDERIDTIEETLDKPDDLQTVNEDGDEPTAPVVQAKSPEETKTKGVAKVPLSKVGVSLNSLLDFSEWRRFKAEHNKSYASSEEEETRFNIFLANKEKVERHNAEFEQGKTSFRLALNKFSDQLTEEFTRKVNGFKRSLGDNVNRAKGARFLAPFNVRVPTKVDWREPVNTYVTPVKDQGHCGSCWAFSSTGALEGQHSKKAGKLVSLSEQNLVDCSGPYGNQGCNGGLMDQAFTYIKENHGVDTEKSYPYEGKDGRCRFKKPNVGADDAGFVDVDSKNETALEIAVATVGPVSVAIDASHESFQMYGGGVYFEPQCDPENLDHGVLVVGYGVSEQGEEYWIVKNSWGAGWGEKGYIRMAKNKKNHCGIATAASYPLV